MKVRFLNRQTVHEARDSRTLCGRRFFPATVREVSEPVSCRRCQRLLRSR